ncbi:hypothetical protein KC357_g60 [Hortaea werneckii]|nr:hypothetical protein KC357_g60 [Hortaea werneckii]
MYIIRVGFLTVQAITGSHSLEVRIHSYDCRGLISLGSYGNLARFLVLLRAGEVGSSVDYCCLELTWVADTRRDLAGSERREEVWMYAKTRGRCASACLLSRESAPSVAAPLVMSSTVSRSLGSPPGLSML